MLVSENLNELFSLYNCEMIETLLEIIQVRSKLSMWRRGRKMLRERIGVWEEDSIYWVEKVSFLDKKKRLDCLWKTMFFSSVVCKKNFGRGQKVFVKRAKRRRLRAKLKFFDQLSLEKGDFHNFIFTQLSHELSSTKRVKNFSLYDLCLRSG